MLWCGGRTRATTRVFSQPPTSTPYCATRRCNSGSTWTPRATSMGGETLNPPGRALPAAAWSLYRAGCSCASSVRRLSPPPCGSFWPCSRSSSEVWQAPTFTLLPNSQGFAPPLRRHQAVLQLEGRKLWRVYRPRVPTEELALTSSPNFSQDDLESRCCRRCWNLGDLLYFPPRFHSPSRMPGWGALSALDLVHIPAQYLGRFPEAVLPLAVQAAMEENVEFVGGCPETLWITWGPAFGFQGSAEELLSWRRCGSWLPAGDTLPQLMLWLTSEPKTSSTILCPCVD